MVWHRKAAERGHAGALLNLELPRSGARRAVAITGLFVMIAMGLVLRRLLQLRG